ncbi:MAG: DUF2249 domain-containing protein, partial [Leptospiraceae bacterium]|nr:DUF2249 domain-containing protein [Leptospiraceae bacterium]
PVLRKIMAGQTTIAMAARIGGISISQILGALSQLGLPVKKEADGEGASQPSHERPVSEVDFAAAFERIESKNLQFVDARPMIEKGQEPLSAILSAAQQVLPGQGLRILNSFPPEPLLSLLAKQGFQGRIYQVEEGYEARFIRWDLEESAPKAKPSDALSEEGRMKSQSSDTRRPLMGHSGAAASDSDEAACTPSASVVVRLSVVGLSPPEPLLRILKTLGTLAPGRCLYVFHEREPRFLFPHLAEGGYRYRMVRKGPEDVRLLIGARTGADLPGSSTAATPRLSSRTEPRTGNKGEPIQFDE